MSADNYYTIRQDDDGKFVAVMGFMSDLEEGRFAVMKPRHRRFNSWDEAADFAIQDWSEYGLIEELDPDL